MKWIRFVTIYTIFLIILFGSVAFFIYNNKISYFLSEISVKLNSAINLNLNKSKAMSLDTLVPTSEWKTYENDRYKYSIKYRPEFEIRELEEKSWVSVDNIIENNLPLEKDWFLLTIKINPNDSNLTTKQYIELYAKSNPNCKNKILDSFKEYKNNEISGLKGNIDPCSNEPNVSVVFTKGDYAFIIKTLSDKSFKPTFTETKLKLFDQILSTFQFTE